MAVRRKGRVGDRETKIEIEKQRDTEKFLEKLLKILQIEGKVMVSVW